MSTDRSTSKQRGPEAETSRAPEHAPIPAAEQPKPVSLKAHNVFAKQSKSQKTSSSDAPQHRAPSPKTPVQIAKLPGKLHEVTPQANAAGLSVITEYPWRLLQVGDRFVIRRTTPDQSPMPGSIRVAAYSKGRKMGWKFSVGVLENDIYVRRTK